MSLKVASAISLEGVVTIEEYSDDSTQSRLSRLSKLSFVPQMNPQHIDLSNNELISLRDYLNVRFPAEDIGQPVDENQLSLLFDLVKNPIANFVPAKAEEPAVVYVRTCMNCRYEALPGSRLQCIDCCKTILRPNFTSKN